MAKSKEPSPGLSFEDAQKEFLAALERLSAPSPLAPAPAASPAPVNFDTVLESLGRPEHQPPPLVQALLSEPASEEAVQRSVLPDPPPRPGNEDRFADLEQSLRAFEPARERSVPAAAPSAPAAPDDALEHEILDELEAWLAAIRR